MGRDCGLDQRLDPRAAVHRVRAHAAHRLRSDSHLRRDSLCQGGGSRAAVGGFLRKNPVLSDAGGRNKRAFLTNVTFVVRKFDLGLYSGSLRNRVFPAL